MVTLSSLRQQVETQQGTSGLDSAQVSAISGSGGSGSGVSVYETLDSLPSTGLTAGQQAFITGTSRLYISNGSGWYNTTLVNRNPQWDSGGEPDASYAIADSATPLIITAKAIDSDNSNLLNQAFASDSAQYMVSITNDSSVWTFTPKSADSIGDEVAAGNLSDSNGDFVYTFKWSDGINFVSKAATISYSPTNSALYDFTSITFWNGVNSSSTSTTSFSRTTTNNSASPRNTTRSNHSNSSSYSDHVGLYNTSTYPWITDTAFFNVTNGIIAWTVPLASSYQFSLQGARGGNGGGGGVGGTAAYVEGTISLLKGDVIKILVGKPGENAITGNSGGGGGGGTFVFVNATDTYPLFAAGGGGGGQNAATGYNAATGTSGVTASESGGTNGAAGGNSSDGNYDAGSGAGWLTGNGEITTGNDATLGYAPRNGGYGGYRSADGNDDWGGHGGFGGGGGGTTENGGGAGGGGYSGGGAAAGTGGGGGGGSYITGTATNTSTTLVSSSEYSGKVTITRVV